jgi:hypothetical protein
VISGEIQIRSYDPYPQLNLEVALNYKTTNFTKNSITIRIQPLSSIPAKTKSISQKNDAFFGRLPFNPKPKGGRS